MNSDICNTGNNRFDQYLSNWHYVAASRMQYMCYCAFDQTHAHREWRQSPAQSALTVTPVHEEACSLVRSWFQGSNKHEGRQDVLLRSSRVRVTSRSRLQNTQPLGRSFPHHYKVPSTPDGECRSVHDSIRRPGAAATVQAHTRDTPGSFLRFFTFLF